MKKLTEAAKRKITSSWHEFFPELGTYKPMWLLRRCGPLLTGVCLYRGSDAESYIPTAHVHCLVSPFPVVTLGVAQRLESARNGAEDWIYIKWHERRWQEAAARLSRQSLLPLSGPITLEQVQEMFNRYRLFPGSKIDTRLYEEWLLSLAWAGREDDVQRVLAEAERDMSTWPEHVLVSEGGLGAWLRRMRKETSDPERLRRIVEEELIKHNAEHLPSVDVSSWFIGPPPELPKPTRSPPEPTLADRLKRVVRRALQEAPLSPTLGALRQAGEQGEWLIESAELELLTSSKEAREFLLEGAEGSPALAKAMKRLCKELAFIATDGNGNYLALWRFAPEMAWEQSPALVFDERVGFYCTAASLADHVVLALGEREEEALAWFRERGLNVSASVAEARARLRRLPSPEYRLHRYQQEEEARQRGERAPEPAPTRTAEPQQLADLLGMSAEDARVEALLRTVEHPEQPLEVECDEWGRVALLSLAQENLRALLAVEGLHLGDAQEQVHATLGAPSASDKDWERYDRQERGLRLDYRWGRVRSVTLLWLPAVPERWR